MDDRDKGNDALVRKPTTSAPNLQRQYSMRAKEGAPKIARRRSLVEVSRVVSTGLREASSILTTGRSAAPHAVVTFSLSEVPETCLNRFPNFYSVPYDIGKASVASNVLALVHSAAQRELVDLVKEIIPACAKRAELEDGSNDECAVEMMGTLKKWWTIFSKFSKFVAAVEENIVDSMHRKLEKDVNTMFDNKEMRSAEKTKRKLVERTSFTMEFVFRAVDETIEEGVREATQERFKRFVHTANIVVNFLLDTYDMVMQFVKNVEEKVKKGKISGLSYAVMKELETFAGEDRKVMTFMLVRWMQDERLIRAWGHKYVGFRARRLLNYWEQEFEETKGLYLKQIRELGASEEALDKH